MVYLRRDFFFAFVFLFLWRDFFLRIDFFFPPPYKRLDEAIDPGGKNTESFDIGSNNLEDSDDLLGDLGDVGDLDDVGDLGDVDDLGDVGLYHIKYENASSSDKGCSILPEKS